MNLDEIDLRINRVVSAIKDELSKSSAPVNTMRPRDAHWGKRSVTLNMRLDEFDIITLEKNLPRLKSLFAEFNAMRNHEAELIDKMDITRSMERGNALPTF